MEPGAEETGWTRAAAAAAGETAGAELPMEPLGSRTPDLEEPQCESFENRRSLSPAQSPSPVDKKLPPSPRPALLRVPPLSLGYGAFRRHPGAAAGPEPPPGPAEAPGPELLGPCAAPPEEPGPGSWAPMELQVDVRVTPVGAAPGSLAPSPAPSRRFLTVPVPESPGFARHAAPAFPLPLLSPSPSPGSTWGSRGSPLIAARAESSCDADGCAGPAEGRAEVPGSPSWRCRCKELGLEKEESEMPLRAEADGALQLPRAVKLVGLPMYLKSLQWALAIMTVLVAMSAVSIIALVSRAGARCRLCPPGWMWSEELCFYLSPEAQAWEASQAFCLAHHASLPLLSHTQDLLARFPVTVNSWVGARRGPEGWHWIDEDPLPSQLLPAEDQDQLDLQCGVLRAGRLEALNCALPQAWVCVRGTK
ncbi:killer cell lectin-like receptor subfamily G member 2 [Suncus etruscus]|uniref:killer cell lectin-like receptor subfamily G member 2 n=1 Tax=Suncus etruscus TaxID=109475 RepID=UPI00211079D2|nr:killer cell lectin-like receptor subfamily G member 2 [Suncus etruscus]